MREIITPGGRRTWLREIAEFSTKLQEAPTEIGRVDTSGILKCLEFLLEVCICTGNEEL